jgi:hypothetical protein
MWTDWDLDACLDNNDIGISPSDITAILAVWEGENDEDDWRWIVQLTDGQFALIQGWCDYTGWDCQSGARVHRGDSPEDAIAAAMGQERFWEGEWALPEHVLTSLRDQLVNGKKKTWREETDEKFGITSKYLPRAFV